MSKILFIGDPHLKITRFQVALDFLKWINKTIADVKPDLVINLGDTFDTHAVVRSEILAEVRKHICCIVDMGISYMYVLGNHDMFKPNDSKYHALQTLADLHKNFRVIDEVVHFKNLNMTIVPYQPDHTKFPKETMPICVAHQTFVGADYGYHRPDVGVDADKVSAELIVSGHIHRRQEFGKVKYPGSPFAQSVGDINQIKGIMILDTSNYKCEYIDSPLPQWRGLKFELSPELTVNKMHEQLVNYINDSDHWIVDIRGPRAEVVAYLDSKEWIEVKKQYSIRPRPDYIDKDKERIKIKSVTADSITTDYIRKVYSGSLDKKLLEKRALEIIKEVNKTQI
jgi:DNA repair exonuclease SbcCD nuclease subunit